MLFDSGPSRCPDGDVDVGYRAESMRGDWGPSARRRWGLVDGTVSVRAGMEAWLGYGVSRKGLCRGWTGGEGGEGDTSGGFGP